MSLQSEVAERRLYTCVLGQITPKRKLRGKVVAQGYVKLCFQDV